MEAYNMKSNKRNLIAVFLYLTASICYVFAAALQTEMLPKVLYSISAVCFLIGSIGLFHTYMKKRKDDDK